MSLEDALNANTKAQLAHNALLEKMMAGAKPAASAAAATAAKPAADKPAAAKPAAATKKKAETTSEYVAEKVKAYLKGGTEDERAVRKEHVKSINEYYGVDRFTEVDPAKYDEALAFLDEFAAGNDPFSEDNDGAGEVDDDDDDGTV